MPFPKAILLSLPWASHLRPSLSIGALAAYAGKSGFDVSAFHLHLSCAASLGLRRYDTVASNTIFGVGEAILASVLFPDQQRRLLAYAERRVTTSLRIANDIHRILRAHFNEIRWAEYDIVGFSANYEQLFASLIFAKWIKNAYPHITTIMGGRLVAGKLGSSILRNFPQVDYCVDGEGEIPFIAILESFRNNEHVVERNIPGLIHRHKESIKINPQAQITDLADLPEPDYDHYFQLLREHPRLKEQALTYFVPIEAGRGCKYRCAFCDDSPFWHGHRSRPTSAIVASIESILRSRKLSTIYIVDEMLPPKLSLELFAKLESTQRDYRLFCQFRAGMPKSCIQSMKRAGVREVGIGIEALDTRLLQKMKKGTRLIDNLETMKHCEEAGIRYHANLIIGFPTETQSDVDRSTSAVDYCIHLRPPDDLIYFVMCENSPIYNNPKRYGISSIDEAALFGKLLPKRIRKSISIWYKSFKSKRTQRNYQVFIQAHLRWQRLYHQSLEAGESLLCYDDCRTFIKVSDARSGKSSLILSGLAAELYRFCDSTRTIRQILEHHKHYDSSTVLSALRQLCRLKIMYREDASFLSLAIKQRKYDLR